MPNLQQLNDRAARAADRLQDLRGEYREVIRAARQQGKTEQADALQATWDAARAPYEAAIAERDRFVAGG